jgi:hypothetical protein
MTTPRIRSNTLIQIQPKADTHTHTHTHTHAHVHSITQHNDQQEQSSATPPIPQQQQEEAEHTNNTSTSTKTVDHRAVEKDILKHEKMLQQRSHILNEIIDTEYTYCRDLELLINVYYKQLYEMIEKTEETGQRRQLLTRDEMKTLFSNLPNIQLLSQGFLSDLMLQQARWQNMENENQTQNDNVSVNDMMKLHHSRCIGHVFIKYGKFFSMYSEYVKSYENGLKLLQSIIAQSQ